MANLPEPVSTARMRELELLAFEKFGIPPSVLMENAGREAASALLETYPDLNRIAVVCGRGNNAGDGFVAARYLKNAGKTPELFMLFSEDELKGDSLANYSKISEMRIPVHPWTALKNSNPEILVDAVFGTGLSRDVTSPASDCIEWINRAGIPVVSLDIPSGLDGDTGQVMGVSVQADMTLCFGVPKCGLFSGSGPEMAGQIRLIDIGLPRQLLL